MRLEAASKLRKGRETMTPQTAAVQANLFELSGHGTSIAYSTTSIDGKPRFHYKDHNVDLNFSGSEIRTEDSELGKLVTVSIKRTIDTGNTTATLLLPAVDLAGANERPLTTVVIVSKHIGPIHPGHTGQEQDYAATVLHGHAKFVVF